MNDDNPIVEQAPLLDEDDRTTVTLDAEELDDTSTETDWDKWATEDDDRGCELCSGCAYCQDSGGYDQADEI